MLSMAQDHEVKTSHRECRLHPARPEMSSSNRGKFNISATSDGRKENHQPGNDWRNPNLMKRCYNLLRRSRGNLRNDISAYIRYDILELITSSKNTLLSVVNANLSHVNTLSKKRKIKH